MLLIKRLSDLLILLEESKTDHKLTGFSLSRSDDAYFIIENFTFKADILTIVYDKSGEIITTIDNLKNLTKAGRHGFNIICDYFIDGYIIVDGVGKYFVKTMDDLLNQLDLTVYAKEHLSRDNGITYNLNKLSDIDKFYNIIYKKTQESIDFMNFISKINDKLYIYIKEYLIIKELGYKPDITNYFRHYFAIEK